MRRSLLLAVALGAITFVRAAPEIRPPFTALGVKITTSAAVNPTTKPTQILEPRKGRLAKSADQRIGALRMAEREISQPRRFDSPTSLLNPDS